ncbi:glyoxalase family protein [Natronobacillus azotifigens]|uniref:Ring-cleaving dioxygenase n=1 Tax=Natronobacillus azotifigens TaxID=472978 RepID=A0A9J6RAB2_9BACI|nr:ring-cleaving dioxygenase [Natronobacillus azotifigens]MCZ0702479.1 ring-cleaving dioxygenase [Natronobacillus azotifigens]
MQLTGIHHVSALTASAKKNYTFYTEVLGMRLVKKSVNQDSPNMYHLFYADEIGSPGTDLTFFEMIGVGHTYEGNNSISLTSLRVQNDEALSYWVERFNQYEVKHQGIEKQFGRSVLFFQDPEGQRLMLVSDQENKGVASGIPWEKSPVPQRYGITGLGPVKLTVPEKEMSAKVLTTIMGFRKVGSYSAYQEGQPEVEVYQTGEGGTGAEVHLEIRVDLAKEKPGRGSVHHVAFRVSDKKELEEWHHRLKQERIPNSGVVDRYYFQSLYFREPNGILYELATDGPGFTTDESSEHLGESLALPPFLEKQRSEIESNLTPLITK